ncbi:MAG: formylmethanofuran dehydrogenase subunit A [bacterium]|uniref:Formylmethanofuran dehydrogenase subunit A n=1 Tax=Candidatus Methylomirabilis tolerans TaxID=3123416 RepID=A0AAJ1AG83_9BACT|nr:formylmethanofuran dehydrogenase subunit A [Candidatus Methylomirabilis sp.]
MGRSLRIVGGEVYDPANGIDGAIKEICVEDGKIVESCTGPAEVIDAANLVVMPGGVDIHTHVGSPAVNAARGFRPEDHRHMHFNSKPAAGMRSGVGSTVPSTFATGYLYAQMGYTTVMEGANAPIGVRHTHEELIDIPIVDKGLYIELGSNEFILKFIKAGEMEKVKRYVAWLLKSLKAYGVKLVNPGGVEAWKYGKDVANLDDKVHYFDVTPRQILKALAWANESLGLPHSIHLHANSLGTPNNYLTTLDTMRTLEGSRLHVAHAQFHSYGGENWGGFCSKAAEIAEYINTHPNITTDIGQIVFGDATTITADGPWQYRLYKLSKNKWYNQDVEIETGCGIVPYTYRENNFVNALQWAIGLELFLLIRDPWRVFLSTDHPNGGPFYLYPWIIRLLMDKPFRDEMLKRVHKRVLPETMLSSLDREYTLNEIAIISRAGPARALGLTHKGHLGVGADADITIYSKDSDKEHMFEHPVYVIKDGETVLRDGEIVHSPAGKTLFVVPPEVGEMDSTFKTEFENYYTIRYQNFPIDIEDIPNREAIPVGAPR